jgi:uncharacterized protein (TIGR02588 family)
MSARGARTGSASEVFVLSISLLIVGGFVAVALWMSTTTADQDDEGLEVTFDVAATVERDEGYFVPYAITNHTSSGVAAAEIWIEVFDGDQQVETAEIRVEFLPVESRQEGLYISKYDPSEYDFRGRLESRIYPIVHNCGS